MGCVGVAVLGPVPLWMELPLLALAGLSGYDSEVEMASASLLDCEAKILCARAQAVCVLWRLGCTLDGKRVEQWTTSDKSLVNPV